MPKLTQADVDFTDAQHLGGELRGLRRSRGLTLAALGAKLGRSVGYLSEVERGLTIIAVDDLRRVARLLGVPISWFLVDTANEESERGRIVRWGRRRRIGSPGGSTETGLIEELLSPDLGGAFEVIHATFAPGAERSFFITRDTEETGYVVGGELTLWIGGEEYHLTQGDSFRINREPARWRNAGRVPATVVWVIAPPVY
jgi:transcriptional regulator with XRE-family HTH domain